MFGKTFVNKKILIYGPYGGANLGDDLLFNRSMLQYNSMPNTQIPNDRKSFENYLYGNMLSGKEGNPLALERKYGGAYNYTNP